jgi:hypothetical protein
MKAPNLKGKRLILSVEVEAVDQEGDVYLACKSPRQGIDVTSVLKNHGRG